mmetsp:Transcript_26564/g.57938  ORF Transcript_26564/g.57938 Transcript_26564/m.57938 type:complete len:306 (+) Transcript_26564:83-1000(+)
MLRSITTELGCNSFRCRHVVTPTAYRNNRAFIVAQTKSSKSSGDEPGASSSRDKIPVVVPSYVIPPPNKGSQYDKDAADWLGGGVNGGNAGEGGGKNRGGAYNLFTGGFFGPGGGASSLWTRLRLIVLYALWAGCIMLIYKGAVSVLKALANMGLVSSRKLGWAGREAPLHEQEGEEDSEGSDALLSEEEVAVAAVATTTALQEHKVKEQVQGHGSAGAGAGAGAGAQEGDASAAAAAVGAADVVAAEAKGMSEEQRAYLDMLRNHAVLKERAAAEGGSFMDLMGPSLAVYLMVMGSVAFFFVIK